MPNYQNGKIYAIKSYQTELIYIGSTVRPLSQRLGQHRTNYKNNTGISSKELLKYSDYYIELIENFPCNSKEELEKQEGIHIRKNSNICVNCYIAGRTYKEWTNDNVEKIKEYQKKYRLNNVEKIKEKGKDYYENNKEIKNQKARDYYKNNKEIKKQKARDYYENNKEIKNQKARERYQKRKELKQIKEPTNNQEPNISEN